MSCQSKNDPSYHIPTDEVYVPFTNNKTHENHEIDSSIQSTQGLLALDDQNFIDLFPSDFQTFTELYAFDSNDVQGKYYHEANAYIEHFFKIGATNKFSITAKAINIAIGGKQDADGVSFYQEKLRAHIIQNNHEALPTIELKSQKEIESIYYFLLDGPVPDNKTNQMFLDELKDLSPQQHKIAAEIFEGLKSEWKH